MRRNRKSNVIAVQRKPTTALFLTTEGKGYCVAFLQLFFWWKIGIKILCYHQRPLKCPHTPSVLSADNRSLAGAHISSEKMPGKVDLWS